MGILRGLVRARLGRGVLAGNPLWIAVGAVVVARRILRRIAPKTEVVYSQRVAPGERVVISHLTERWTDATETAPAD